jgi:O-antigen/teichoic acid export membrane protein
MTSRTGLRPSRTRALAFSAIVIGTVGIALAYASAFFGPPVNEWGPYVMAVALPLCMVGTMSVGAARRGRSLGRLAWPIALVFVLVTGGFLLALQLPPDTVEGPYWLGLPRRAAVILYGVGILPLFVLPFAYALTFDALTLSDDDVARVRAARVGETPVGHR